MKFVCEEFPVRVRAALPLNRTRCRFFALTVSNYLSASFAEGFPVNGVPPDCPLKRVLPSHAGTSFPLPSDNDMIL